MNMKRIRSAKLWMYIVLSLGGLISVLPMVYMISTSLKPNGALYEYPPHFFPNKSNITIENYIYIFQQQKFYVNFINSLVVSLITVFGLVIGTMIIPGTALIVPQFELASFLHITNKLWGLIPFYVAWVIPFSTFMIKGFIENIPRDFDEAVYMDGGNVFTVFRAIAVPLSGPAIASVSIFNFLTAWEEYPWALTVINDNAKRTLPIAIAGFFGEHQFTQWGYVFAMSVASLVPVLIIFICFQKYFVKGLQTGGIKG